MKPYVFAVNLKKPIDSKTFDFLLTIIGKEKRTRIIQHQNKKDRDLMLIGDVLTRYAINKVFQLDFSSIEFETDEHKKPYLKGHNDIFFNISHSGNYVVCAVSKLPVGIDIQQIKDIKYMQIANRYFPKNEITKIKNAKDSLETFYSLWSKKESYVKMLGMGIANGLNCDYQNCKFYDYSCFDGYSMSVCLLDN